MSVPVRAVADELLLRAGLFRFTTGPPGFVHGPWTEVLLRELAIMVPAVLKEPRKTTGSVHVSILRREVRAAVPFATSETGRRHFQDGGNLSKLV